MAPAHAQPQGSVCIVDPGAAITISDACPVGTNSFSGPTQAEITMAGGGSQLRVNVNDDGSSSTNGFDIIILVDHTKLQPFDVDLSSSLLGGATINSLCVAGNPLKGACALQASNLDSLELNIGGPSFTLNPTFGVLFTAIFNIVGDTATPTTIGFQTGCGTVTSLPPTCVTLTSGGTAADAITAANTATYTTAAATTSPFFTFTTTSTTTIFVAAGGTTSAPVTIKVGNGFSCGGIACISATTRIYNPYCIPGACPINNAPTVALSPPAPFLEGGTFSISVATTASTPLGTYVVVAEGSVTGPPSLGNFFLASSVLVTVQVVDFSVAANPTSLTVLAGTAFTKAFSIVTVTSLGGMTGLVTMSSLAQVAGGPTGAFNQTMFILAPGASKNVNFTVTSGTLAGTFSFTIRAIALSSVRITHVSVTVLSSSDFFLTSKPGSVNVLAGALGSSTISVNGGSASTGSVNLSITTISPALGLVCNALSPSSISLPAGGQSTLSCSSALAMTFTVTVTGTGATVHTTSVVFIVQDFALASDQSSITVIVGQQAVAGITATSQNGFAGNITLTSSSLPATGISCVFAVPTGISPSGFIIIPPTVGSSQLKCTGSVANSFDVTLTATNKTLVHMIHISFIIQGFSISANPTSVTVTPNTSGTSIITVSSLQGFGNQGGVPPAGATVSLMVTSPTGISCSLSKMSVGLNNNSTTSTLSCQSATSNTFQVKVTGASGSLSNSVTVTYIVGVPQHSTSTSVACIPNPVQVNTATVCTATVTDSSTTGATTPTGTVTFATSGTGSFSPTTCPLVATATAGQAKCSVNYTPNVVGTDMISAGYGGDSSHAMSTSVGFSLTVSPVPFDYSLSNSGPVSVQAGSSATVTVTVTLKAGTAQPVTLSCVAPPAGVTCTFDTNPVTPTVAGATSLLHIGTSVSTTSFTVMVTGSPLGATTTPTSVIVTVTPVPFDYSLSNSGPVSIQAGSSGAVTITATLKAGTAVSVTLSCVAATLPTGASCSFNPSSVTPTLAGATSTLTISTMASTPTGPFQVQVTGSPLGATTVPTTFTLTVTAPPPPAFDYSLTNSGPVSIVQGSSGTNTITATLTSGTAQSVTLSCVTPLPAGVTCSFGTNPVTPTVAGATSVLTIHTTASTPTGPFTLAVTGGPLGATTTPTSFTVTITAPPFDYSLANSGGISVQQGNSNTNTITVTLVAGTAQSVTLSCVAATLPAGASCSFNPASVTPMLVGATSTLTVSTMATTPTGSFQVQVTGSPLGATTTPTTFTLTVTAPPPPAFDYSLSNSGPVSIVQGSSGTNTITVTLTSGTAQTVTLSCVTPLPIGVTCSFGTNPVTPTVAGATSVLTIHTTASTPTGPFTLSVTGNPLGVTATPTSFTVTITTPPPPAFDYSLSNSGPVSIVQGSSGTNTIAVTLTGGTAQAVTLSCVAPLPTGVTCLFATNPVTPAASGATSVVTIATSASTPTGPFTLAVTGMPLGATTVPTSFTVTVTAPPPPAFDYSLSNSGPVTFVVGSSGTNTITATLTSGTAQATTLSCVSPPAGVTCSFATNPVTPTAAGASSVLTISASAAGTFTLAVTGNPLGATTSSTSFTVTVTAPAFDYLLSNNGPVTVVQGSSGTVTITATLISGAAQPVILSCVAPPAGVTCTFDTNPVTPTVAGATSLLHIGTSVSMISFTVMVTGSPLGATTTPTSVIVTVTAPPPPSKAVLLTFSAFDVDDFDNGVGQLQVLVNGQLVVDIPAGLNHLSGTGDFTAYTNTWVSFGPFDITSFVVQGQNTIVFVSPPPGHFGLVKNVTITQGSSILLHVMGARPVSLSRTVTFTFSIPPLVITSFTISNPAPSVDQPVTFTASFTGGTSPFTCVFRFGDDESASVAGVSGTCAVTHDYDDTGTFTASVNVRGASTSDFVVARITVNVVDNSDVGMGDPLQVPASLPEDGLDLDD